MVASKYNEKTFENVIETVSDPIMQVRLDQKQRNQGDGQIKSAIGANFAKANTRSSAVSPKQGEQLQPSKSPRKHESSRHTTRYAMQAFRDRVTKKVISPSRDPTPPPAETQSKKPITDNESPFISMNSGKK